MERQVPLRNRCEPWPSSHRPAAARHRCSRPRRRCRSWMDCACHANDGRHHASQCGARRCQRQTCRRQRRRAHDVHAPLHSPALQGRKTALPAWQFPVREAQRAAATTGVSCKVEAFFESITRANIPVPGTLSPHKAPWSSIAIPATQDKRLRRNVRRKTGMTIDAEKTNLDQVCAE